MSEGLRCPLNWGNNMQGVFKMRFAVLMVRKSYRFYVK